MAEIQLGSNWKIIESTDGNLVAKSSTGNTVTFYEDGSMDIPSVSANTISDANLDNVQTKSVKNSHLMLLDDEIYRSAEDAVNSGTINADGTEEGLIILRGSRATGLAVVTYYDSSTTKDHHTDLLLWAGVSHNTVINSESRGMSISPSYSFDAGSGDDELSTTVSHSSSLDYTIRFIGHS